MDKLRVGVVGLGKMGLLHTAVCNSLPESRVVAVAEPVKLLRESLAAHATGIKTFESLDAMLDGAALDAVVITTPVAHHIEGALCCAERGLPFLVEKPLAISAGQAEPLVAALRRGKLTNMVGFMTRFIDSFEKGREIVASGCLGRLQRVTGTIYVSQLFKRGQGWRYDKAVSGGGVLMSQGSHLLDLLTWYFGPVARVNADAVSVYSPGIEDFGHAMLEFSSGLRAWVDCSWSVRGKRTVETTVNALGDNGSLVVTDDAVRLFLDEAAGGWPAGSTVLQAPDLYRGVPVDIGGPQYTREDRAFAQAVLAGKPAMPDVAQGFHVQQVIDAAYASAEVGGAPKGIEP
jgi:predicted dehydrogenase